MTHAGIDGFSRMVVYAKCSTNNRASTVYNLFLGAVNKFGLPSRVRSDQGRENVMVARHMIEYRGADRRSMITGSSVHNQRIERLWRDLFTCAIKMYYKLFYFMEERELLDPLNSQNIFALHYIYTPRINRSIREFCEGWNRHGIRTSQGKSPNQLFVERSLEMRHSGVTAVDFFENVSDHYGTEEIDYPVPDDGNDGVEVPECTFSLEEHDFTRLQQEVDPLQESENFGIELYQQTLFFINQTNRYEN